MAGSAPRRLLIVLTTAVALSAAGVSFDLGFQRLRDARAATERWAAKVQKLQQSLPAEARIRATRDSLEKDLASRAAHFYAADEINAYSFGAAVKGRLSALGMTVVRYQVIDLKGRSWLEFSVTGSARALIVFLRDVSRGQKYWSIPSLSLTMRESSDIVDVSFRIGYEVIDSNGG